MYNIESNENPMDNESRLKAIIENAIDGIITIDARGLIETINPAAATIFEYAPEEIIGQNIKILMPEPDHSRHDRYIHNYQQTGVRKIIGIGREVQGKKKSGTTFPFLLSVSEVRLQEKIIYTGIIHDISQLKEVEFAYKKLNGELEERVQQRTSELFQAIKKLEETNKNQRQAQEEARKALVKEKELNELKSRFVTIASHEFRTPLSTIQSSASLIGKYNDLGETDKLAKHVQRIKSAVTNLTGILNDFLSLSKLEEGAINNHPTEFNIKELCEEVKDEMLSVIKEAQKLTCLHQGTEFVFFDKHIIKNILINIVSNAIKYSDKGIIKISTEVDNHKHIRFIISDEGIGIPEKDQPFLFSRFFRAHNAGNIQGTGLGLNIVKRYVELLNGAIEFESLLGKGTTFIIDIPIR